MLQSIMVYQLWEQGLIASLDDEFQKYAPEFAIRSQFGSGSITLRFATSSVVSVVRLLVGILYVHQFSTRVSDVLCQTKVQLISTLYS